MLNDGGDASALDHVQYSLHLTGPLRKAVEALAMRKFKTPQSLIEDLLISKVLEVSGLLNEAEGNRLREERELFERLDEILERIRRLNKWDEDVTRTVFEEIERRHRALYERAIGGDAYESRNATKSRINKQIGARVKEGLKAVVKASRRGGPPRKGSVSNGLIRTYTKLWRA